MKVTNKSFETVFTYLGTTANQNSFEEEVEVKVNSGNAV
jgi:hypothetical protein